MLMIIIFMNQLPVTATTVSATVVWAMCYNQYKVLLLVHYNALFCSIRNILLFKVINLDKCVIPVFAYNSTPYNK